jgi:hypothetical protein
MITEPEEYRLRVIAASERLRALSLGGSAQQGPPDPVTGERWDRRNVLGHMAEMLPFWCRQFRAVGSGAAEIGRGAEGYQRRRRGIDRREVAEADLLAEVDQGINDLVRLLGELDSRALHRRILYRRRDGEEEDTVGGLLDQLLVRHLEEHVTQLAELS